MKPNEEYLGDGLYIVFDGFGFELRVNDFHNPSDRAYLEPAVMQALIKFYNKILGGDKYIDG